MNVYGASALKKKRYEKSFGTAQLRTYFKKNRKKKEKRTADHDYTYIIYVFSLV